VLQDKRVLVVIPARGGSKGIPHKNITPVAGKPLIHYTTELLTELAWIDGAVVSTDDQDIAAEALVAKTAEVVWRPAELAGHRIGDMPVLAHALGEAEAKAGSSFDVVVMLQPTSPLRSADDVLDCASTLIEGDWDAVWTVSESDLTYHPQKQVKILPGGSIEFYLDSGSQIIARQQLESAFHRNGVAYAFTADFVRTADSVFSPGRSSAVVTPGRHISIDTRDDILAVEQAMQGPHKN
jgi:CMP-N-acetylneuraminic acid synthetase